MAKVPYHTRIVPGTSVQDALALGKRVGGVGSSDSHSRSPRRHAEFSRHGSGRPDPAWTRRQHLHGLKIPPDAPERRSRNRRGLGTHRSPGSAGFCASFGSMNCPSYSTCYAARWSWSAHARSGQSSWRSSWRGSPYRQRHCVKPGITRWAQVNHNYGDTIEDFRDQTGVRPLLHQESVFHLGLYIIFRTLKTILLTRGAQ
jgi:hypothetical protein